MKKKLTELHELHNELDQARRDRDERRRDLDRAHRGSYATVQIAYGWEGSDRFGTHHFPIPEALQKQILGDLQLAVDTANWRVEDAERAIVAFTSGITSYEREEER